MGNPACTLLFNFEETVMSNSLIGLYAVPKTGKFAGVVCVAVGYTDNKVTLLDIESNRKITLNRSNVKRFIKDGKMYRCACAEVDGNNYLVTCMKQIIISLKTNRVLKWDDNHGTVKRIKRAVAI